MSKCQPQPVIKFSSSVFSCTENYSTYLVSSKSNIDCKLQQLKQPKCTSNNTFTPVHFVCPLLIWHFNSLYKFHLEMHSDHLEVLQCTVWLWACKCSSFTLPGLPHHVSFYHFSSHFSIVLFRAMSWGHFAALLTGRFPFLRIRPGALMLEWSKSRHFCQGPQWTD